MTGGSRGVGRGVALGLAETGATVYVTGRTSHPGPDPPPGTLEHVAREIEAHGGRAIPVRCDHADDAAIADLFRRIAEESGRLDVLVNNVYSGVADIATSVTDRFWDLGPEMWDRMNRVGLRAHYVAAVHGARLMVRQHAGLILNISSFGSLSYLFNVPYGVGKAALDRLTADWAHELKQENVAVISLYPGFVRTELTAELLADATPGYARIFAAYGESPLVTGRAAAALAEDPHVLRRTGTVQIAGEVARRAGKRDEHGARCVSPRSVQLFARALFPPALQPLARLVPHVRVPMSMVGPILTKFSTILRANGGFHEPAGGTPRPAR